MYAENIYFVQTLQLDCHIGTNGLHHCALDNITYFSCKQNWVSDSDRSRTVSGSKFRKKLDRNRRNFFIYIALSHSTR